MENYKLSICYFAFKYSTCYKGLKIFFRFLYLGFGTDFNYVCAFESKCKINVSLLALFFRLIHYWPMFFSIKNFKYEWRKHHTRICFCIFALLSVFFVTIELANKNMYDLNCYYLKKKNIFSRIFFQVKMLCTHLSLCFGWNK